MCGGDDDGDGVDEVKKQVVVEEKYCYEEDRELTVQKTSMFNQGDGFKVYDSVGDTLFRVDSFGPINHHLMIILMDSSGNPLLTLLPKRPTLHQRWEGFLGEKLDKQQQPIFNIWKSTMIGRSSSVMVETHNNNSDSPTMYQIEGSFSERSCTIYHMLSSSSSSDDGDDDDKSKVLMAEIKRKVEPTRNTVLGRDVFSLNLKAGFDAAFAMGLVLVLDRIDGDDPCPIIECHKQGHE